MYRLYRGVDAPCIVYSAESMLPVSFIVRYRRSPYPLQRGVNATHVVYGAESELMRSVTAS
jgi:hypothetical protein